MSSFLRFPGSLMPTMLTVDDRRTADVMFPRQSPRGQKVPWEDGVLWPASRNMQTASMISEDSNFCSGRYAPWAEEAGNGARKKIVGITRDSASAALGGVAVQAIRASGAECDGTATSDASGYYEIPVADPNGQYKVDAYKAGSPDVAGTTINTLTPA